MSTPSEPTAPGTRLRFHSVDALRGVAALAVVLFHLLRNSPQTAELTAVLPAAYVTMSDYARGGVAVFFVLSGLVITYTVRDLGPRPRDVLRYSARRQLRLDPPYWVMIGVVLAIASAERLVPGLDYRSFGAGDVAANAVYVQGFTASTPVLAVAWTLCLEVQFYLVIVLLVLLAGRLPHGGTVEGRRCTVRWTAWALGVVSLVLLATGTGTGPWFLGAWWMFCLGATVAWYLIGDIGPRTAGAALGAVALAVVVETLTGAADPWRTEWFAWATAVLLAVLVATGRLGARPWGWLLFLGTISYSLYLVHLPVIDTVMAAAYKVLGGGTVPVLAAYVVGLGAAVLAAVLLNRWVERPAIRFSRALTTGSRADVGARVAAFAGRFRLPRRGAAGPDATPGATPAPDEA